jgi:hypothetical protein
MSTPFQDPRASDLLSRVSKDVSLLRQDISNLFSHTTRHTLPEGARGLADNARSRLSNSRDYTAEHLRALRNQVNQPAAAWIGGAVAVGLLAAGVYLFIKSDCCAAGRCGDEDEDKGVDL